MAATQTAILLLFLDVLFGCCGKSHFLTENNSKKSKTVLPAMVEGFSFKNGSFVATQDLCLKRLLSLAYL